MRSSPNHITLGDIVNVQLPHRLLRGAEVVGFLEGQVQIMVPHILGPISVPFSAVS